MKESKDLKSLDRRDFFKKAGVGLGAAGAVAISLSSGAAQAETKLDQGFKKSQYRETEHVRRAYEVSRY